MKHLPPVFPLVVYHGAEAWNAPKHLHEVIAGDDVMREAWSPYLPAFQIALEDLSTQTDEELRARAFTQLGALTVLCLQRLPLTEDPVNELGVGWTCLRRLQARPVGSMRSCRF